MSINRTKQSRKRFLFFLFIVAVIVLGLGLVLSLKWGQSVVSWKTLFAVLTKSEHIDKEYLYVQTIRLPRTLTTLIVGVHLAVAGLLTQLITRNPLASPHIFGINSGASLAVVVSLVFVSNVSSTGYMLFAFAGAAIGAFLVWSLVGTNQKQPVQIALAGIAVHFFLSSLTEGLIIFNQHTTENMMFWLVGAVDQASWKEVQMIMPFTLIAFIVLLFMLPSFKLLSLDDDISTSLGQHIYLVKAIAALLIIVLAGSAVAICGPIGFVCLIVPHIARALVGIQLPLLVPMTMILGGSLLVYADLLSRFIHYPYESPVGILTAALGGPFFIYLARKKGGSA